MNFVLVVSALWLCTKSQIAPALAAWNLSFALGGSFGVTLDTTCFSSVEFQFFHY